LALLATNFVERHENHIVVPRLTVLCAVVGSR